MDRGEFIAHVSDKTKKNMSPGPAAYNISREFGNKTAPIRMKGRNKPRDQELTNYPLYNIPSTFGNVPKIHMGVRANTRTENTAIGPSYIPPKFGTQAKKVSIRPPSFSSLGDKDRRVSKRDPSETPGPGPGAYDTQDKTFVPSSNKGITMKGQHKFGYNVSESPGPGSYVPHYEKVLPASPKITFHTRPKGHEPAETPGYRNIGSTLGGPKFTMKARQNDDVYIV